MIYIIPYLGLLVFIFDHLTWCWFFCIFVSVVHAKFYSCLNPLWHMKGERECLFYRRSNKSILKEISAGGSLEGMMLKLKLQYFGYLMRRVDSLEKTLMLGGIAGRRRRGRQRMDEMAGWHHWLDGRGSEWTPGVGDGQGGLACCDSWGHKESDATEWLNWTELI